MSATRDNLMRAFQGESMANRKYLAFAQKAGEEGYPEVAALFRKHAEEETAHALAHLSRLGLVGSTRENLEAAIAGETGEYTEMYPEFARQARDEGDENAAVFFEALAEIEGHHAQEYFKALQKLDGKQIKWRCDVCGYVHTEDEPPDRCPRCGSTKDHFHLTE